MGVFGMAVVTVVAVLLVTCCCEVQSGASSSNVIYQSGGRDRPRTIRGFKNAALSTARGFGKRTAPLSSDSDDYYTPDKLPAEWFVNELTDNPQLARLVVRKFIDLDKDGLLSTSELLRPQELAN